MSNNIEDISNFFQLSARIATAGQPTIEQYPAIAAAGYQVVINLALTDSPFPSRFCRTSSTLQILSTRDCGKIEVESSPRSS